MKRESIPGKAKHTAGPWLKGMLILLGAAFIIARPASDLYAHPPKDVSLSYDAQAQVLTVTILHSSFFPQKHYIKTVSIAKNGTAVSSTAYTSQPDKIVYSYPVSASPGDVITANAVCNMFGAREGKTTVPK